MQQATETGPLAQVTPNVPRAAATATGAPWWYALDLRESEQAILELIAMRPMRSGEIRKAFKGRFADRTIRLALWNLRKESLVVSSLEHNPIHEVTASGNEAAMKRQKSGNEAATLPPGGWGSVSSLAAAACSKIFKSNEQGQASKLETPREEAAMIRQRSGNEAAMEEAAIGLTEPQVLLLIRRELDARERAKDMISSLVISESLRRQSEAKQLPSTPQPHAAALSVPLAAHPANSKAPIQPMPEAGTDEAESVAIAKRLAVEYGRSEQEAEHFALEVLRRDHGKARRALHGILEKQAKGKEIKDPVSLFHYLYNNNAGSELGNWSEYAKGVAKRPPVIAPGKKIPPFAANREWTEEECKAWREMTEAEKAAFQKAKAEWQKNLAERDS